MFGHTHTGRRPHAVEAEIRVTSPQAKDATASRIGGVAASTSSSRPRDSAHRPQSWGTISFWGLSRPVCATEQVNAEVCSSRGAGPAALKQDSFHVDGGLGCSPASPPPFWAACCQRHRYRGPAPGLPVEPTPAMCARPWPGPVATAAGAPCEGSMSPGRHDFLSFRNCPSAGPALEGGPWDMGTQPCKRVRLGCLPGGPLPMWGAGAGPLEAPQGAAGCGLKRVSGLLPCPASGDRGDVVEVPVHSQPDSPCLSGS